MRPKWGPHLPPTSETVQCRREKKKGRESFSFHVCLTRLPLQAALTDGDADVEEEQLLAALRCN